MINQPNIPSDMMAFFQEMSIRLKQRSPFFFRVLNAFWGALTVLSILLWVAEVTGVFTILPEPWGSVVIKVSSFVSAACLFMGNLTVDKKVTEDQKAIVADTEAPLPFTEKKNIQQSTSNT